MVQADINFLAVFLSAVASMVIGAIWYSPGVFGKAWMALVGKTEDDVRKANAAPLYAGSFVLALVLAYVLAHFVDYAQATTLAEGAQLGLWAWVGFVATTKAVDHLFVGKPFKLFAITAGYHLVEFVVMGTLLAVWQ